MNYPVIVQQNSPEEFIAEPLGRPELRIVARTEAEALRKAVSALTEWLGAGKIVDVEIPPSKTENPWLKSWGRSADDPDFDEYLAEIARARTLEDQL